MLTSFEVDFFIVGGQAKYFHFGIPTRDLDIWTPVDGNRAQKLECALRRWIDEHPMHNDEIAFSSRSLNLKPNLQIHIPMHDVWFTGENGELFEIKIDDGIDILTSIGSMDFEEFLIRAEHLEVGGQDYRILSVYDLDVAQTIRSEREKSVQS